MKIVIFDWGQVLTDLSRLACTDNYDLWKRVISRMGYTYNDETIDKSLSTVRAYHHKCEKKNSDSTYLDFVTRLLEAFDVGPTIKNIAKFKECYIKDTLTWKPNYELVEFAHSLYKEGVKVGLFSNLTILDKYKQDIDVNRAEFDFVWLSCDMGSRKPEAESYEKVMNDLGPSYEILFVDNNAQNIESAKIFGWDTFLYKGDNKECIDYIKEFIRSE